MGVDYVQGFGVQKPRRLGDWLMEEALALNPCSMGGAQSGWRRRSTGTHCASSANNELDTPATLSPAIKPAAITIT